MEALGCVCVFGLMFGLQTLLYLCETKGFEEALVERAWEKLLDANPEKKSNF